ncbi:uncharacterized protein LACBIDRAFT_336354, partial [Laccaria bicolor S238N-H82]
YSDQSMWGRILQLSNIANINIDEDMDADPREPDVEIPSLPHTPQRKGKAKQMSSPQTPELQGASCVIGGVLCGHAHGNKANMADLIDADKDANDSHEILGKVLLYLSNDNPATINPAETQSTTSCLIPMASNIKPTLEKVATKYSPIKS